MASLIIVLKTSSSIPKNAPFIVTASGGSVTFPTVQLINITQTGVTTAWSQSTLANGASVESQLSTTIANALVVGDSYRYSAFGTNTSGSNYALIGYYTGGTTFTFDANGGTGGPGTTTLYWANDSSMTSFRVTIPATEPTRAGYTFLGWSTSSSATAASYAPGDNITVGVTTLYAVWSRNTSSLVAAVKVSNTWKLATDVEVKVNGTWTPAIEMYIKQGGAWKLSA